MALLWLLGGSWLPRPLLVLLGSLWLLLASTWRRLGLSGKRLTKPRFFSRFGLLWPFGDHFGHFLGTIFDGLVYNFVYRVGVFLCIVLCTLSCTSFVYRSCAPFCLPSWLLFVYRVMYLCPNSLIPRNDGCQPQPRYISLST